MIEQIGMRQFSLMLPLMVLACLLFLLPATPAMAAAQDTASGMGTTSNVQSSGAVMQQFAGDEEIAPERIIEEKRKHQILFIMGLSLLVLLLITGSLGVAMVAFDKEVFVAHMIFAGLSLTLSAVHAATAIAWFWPY